MIPYHNATITGEVFQFSTAQGRAYLGGRTETREIGIKIWTVWCLYLTGQSISNFSLVDCPRPLLGRGLIDCKVDLTAALTASQRSAHKIALGNGLDAAVVGCATRRTATAAADRVDCGSSASQCTTSVDARRQWHGHVHAQLAGKPSKRRASAPTWAVRNVQVMAGFHQQAAPVQAAAASCSIPT